MNIYFLVNQFAITKIMDMTERVSSLNDQVENKNIQKEKFEGQKSDDINADKVISYLR